MTMTATAAAPGGAGLLTSTWILARRATLVFLRRPELILLSVVRMTSVMLLFRYVFGGAIEIGQGLSYADFAVPGFIAVGVLFQTMDTAIGTVEDLESGLLDRLRSMPFPPTAVLTGRMLADTAILAFVLTVTTAVGFAAGFRLHGSVLSGLAAFGLCLVFGFVFSWVFIAVGLFTRNAKAAQGASVIVFGVTFASSAFVPVEYMPGWFRVFAENQPVTAMADAVRALALGDRAEALLGHPPGYLVVHALVWAAGILVVFAALTTARFRRV